MQIHGLNNNNWEITFIFKIIESIKTNSHSNQGYSRTFAYVFPFIYSTIFLIEYFTPSLFS